MTEPPTSHRHGHPHPHGRLRGRDTRGDQRPELTLHRPRRGRTSWGTHRGTQCPIRTPLPTHLCGHVTGLPTPVLGSHRHPPFASRCCDNQLNPPCDPRSEWTTTQRGLPRWVTAISSAFAAILAFMRESMEYPTILLLKASLTAHKYSFPSRVWCSVISISHSRFGASARNFRSTRSSCAGGPGGVCLRLRVVMCERIPATWHSRHTLRSEISYPRSAMSSASTR